MTAELRTTDPAQAVDRISSVFSPHRLDILGPHADLNVTLRARSTSVLTIADISHGTEVMVRPGELSSYYEINIPISGGTHSSCGDVEVVSDTSTAVILAPQRESTMRWSSDCKQIAVKVSREHLDSTLEQLLGRHPDGLTEFTMDLDLTGAAGKSWIKAVELLRESIDSGAPDFVLKPLEDLVVRQLLAIQPNTFSSQLAGEPRPARPRTLTRVIDFIEAEPGAPHTVSSLAAISGVSVRSLQATFAQYLGIAPMEYVRRVRLARCRIAFLEAEPGAGNTVADIAFQNGFSHLPRFAAAYRRQYGESPSDTLRR